MELYEFFTQGEAFKVLHAIISENMRRIKNMFRQKFYEFEGDIRWYYFTMGGVVKVRAKSLLIF